MLYSLLFSQKEIELFRGGMFLHSGYVKNNLSKAKVDGALFGIGGKLSFRIGNHFRLGTEGYVSNYNYPNNKGKYKIGWGGILTEYQFTNKKLSPVIGLNWGAGSTHDLFTLSGNFTDNNSDNAIYKVYSNFVISPNLSLEYKLNSHMCLATKIDYNLYPFNEYKNYTANGLRFYIGILFIK